jgi:hypothetical protein
MGFAGRSALKRDEISHVSENQLRMCRRHLHFAGACAKSPESIAPSYVSPMTYGQYQCDQLGAEAQRVEGALVQVSAQQRQARSNDTVGVIFLGLPVSSLSGGNVADQVARLKGERQTLRQVMTEKRCATPPVAPPVAPAVAPAS